ncbi:hypothetical protein QU593_16215 [Rossellomorea marisflavi]|uniref:hypothetical protein n=1 Tax=Rossellomorea marisflavi TaxID=189381 RepID=UPI0025B18F00|nr:hypothetical protein [Rossellomorea marisflavi]WJV17672.1 hypothetical protein QU593_16215 [Rossellomorea marisflavi]
MKRRIIWLIGSLLALVVIVLGLAGTIYMILPSAATAVLFSYMEERIRRLKR